MKSLRELHLKRISACTPQFCELLGRLNLSSLCLKTNWTIDEEIVRKLAFALLGPRMNYDPEESKEYFPFSELRKLENIKLEIRGAENQYTWQMFLEIILSSTNLKKLSLNYTTAFNENENRIFHYVPFSAFEYIIQDQKPLNLEILNVGIDARSSASLTYDLFFKYFSDQHHMRSLKIMFEDHSNSLALQNEYLFPHLPIKVKLCYFRSVDKESRKEIGNKEGMWKKEFQELENQIITEWFSTFKVIVLNQIIPRMNLEEDYMYLENIPIFWEFDEMRYLVRTFETKMEKFQEFWPGITFQKLEYLRREAQEGLLTRAMSQGKEIIMELCIQEVIRRNQNIIQKQVDTHLENELLRNPREKFFAHVQKEVE